MYSSRTPPQYHSKQEITNAVVRLLANREHSKQELIDKLHNRCVDISDLEQVIAQCEENGYQSDLRYAQMILRTRVEQGYGLSKLEQEFEIKGIESETAHLALEEAACDWYEIALDCFMRKYHRSYDAEDQKSHAKTVRSMAGRGFSMDEVFQAIADANQHDL